MRVKIVDALKQSNLGSEHAKAAEQCLKQFETVQGFYYTLLDIYFDSNNIPMESRWMALIYIKNGIDRYWRKSTRNCIQPEEQSAIRGRLLFGLNETHRQMAKQVSLIISKIARSDYPKEWPDLFSKLFQTLQQSVSPGMMHLPTTYENTLNTMNQVIKALCSKSLPANRKEFEQLAPKLVEQILPLFDSSCTSLIQSSSSIQEIDWVLGQLRIVLISMKSLRRCFTFGYRHINRVDAMTLFLTRSIQLLNFWLGVFLQESLHRFPETASRTAAIECSEKVLIYFGKLFLDVFDIHTMDFLVLAEVPSLIRLYWEIIQNSGGIVGVQMLDDNKRKLMERLLLQSFQIFRVLIKHPSQGIKETPCVQKTILNGIFTVDFVKHFAEVVLTQFLPLTREDLEKWDTEPETWLIEEDADAYEWHLRPCAEKVWMDLLCRFKDILVPLLADLLKKMSDAGAMDSPDLNISLQMEAVLNAMGLGATWLVDVINIDAWLHDIFSIATLSNPNRHDINDAVIRRRVCLVIGKWISIKCSRESRPLVYTILHRLLSDRNFIVRASAALTFKPVVDDWEFEPPVFAEFVQPVINGMVNILSEDDSDGGFELRMNLISVLSLIVERMDGYVNTTLANVIISILPKLWQAQIAYSSRHDDGAMFQSAIIILLQRMVVVLKGLPDLALLIRDFVIPVIELSVDHEKPESVYLLEDGLELWRCAIRCVHETHLDSDTLHRFIYLMRFLTKGSQNGGLLTFAGENFKLGLKICESYVVLSPEHVLNHFSDAIFSSLLESLGWDRPGSSETLLKSQGVTAIMHLVDIMLPLMIKLNVPAIRLADDQTTPSTFIVFLLAAFNHLDRSTDPATSTPALVCVTYLGVFLKLSVVADSHYFSQLMDFIDRHRGPSPFAQPARSSFGRIMDILALQIDAIGHPKQRKLAGLAISRWIGSPLNESLDVQARFGKLIHLLVDLLNELSDDLNSHGQDRFTMGGEETDFEEEQPIVSSPLGQWVQMPEHQRRRKRVLELNPVYSTTLHRTSLNALQNFEKLNAGPLLQSVDPAIIQELVRLVKPNAL